MQLLSHFPNSTVAPLNFWEWLSDFIPHLTVWACAYLSMLGLKLIHVDKRVLWGINCCSTVYPKKYAHGFVVLCFVVVMQTFIMNSHEVFIHIHQGCFAGTGAIVRLPQCQWSKPDGYGKISLCITTTKHSKAKTVCIFLGILCNHTSSSRITLCVVLSVLSYRGMPPSDDYWGYHPGVVLSLASH